MLHFLFFRGESGDAVLFFCHPKLTVMCNIIARPCLDAMKEGEGEGEGGGSRGEELFLPMFHWFKKYI